MNIKVVLAFLLTVQSSAFVPIKSSTTIRSKSSLYATTTPIADGLSKTVIKEGNGTPLRFGEVATVSYNCLVASTKQPFAKSNKQKVVVGDGVMIDGWETAITTMSVGEKAIISVQDAEKFGYGSQGVGDIVPPNAALELEIEILEAEEQKNLGMAGQAVTGMTGSGELGALDPMKPVSAFPRSYV